MFEQLNPGTVQFIAVCTFFTYMTAYNIWYCFRDKGCCKRIPKIGLAKFWDFNKTVKIEVEKLARPFQEALSNKQREQWLREEISTRMQLGIQHLSN